MKPSQHQSTSLSRLIRATVAFSLLCGGSVVLAQDQSDDEADSPQLEEVIVTAQMREQSFQDLAISASVISPGELDAQGITQIQDALRTVPGVVVQNIAGTGSGRIFIRGIGTTSGDEFDAIIANGVALTLDGVNSNNASNLLSSMFDVERVEVLKGPQGTLYGTGALGGVVNVITARPTHEWEAKARAQYGNYDAKTYQAMLNIPLGETFAIRATATSDEHKGYVGKPDNLNDWYDILASQGFPDFLHDMFIDAFGLDRNASFDDHGGIDTEAYRIRGLWEPNEDMSLLLGYEYQENQGTSPTWVSPSDARADEPQCCNLGVPPAVPPAFATASWYENRFFYRKSETITGQFDYAFGDFAKLTFLGSTNDIKDKGQELSPTALVENAYSDQSQDTYELRLSSGSASKLIWVAGWYYQKTDRTYAINSSDYPPSPADGSYAYNRLGKPFDNQNLYGQATYPVTDRFRLTAGLRYSKTTDDFSYQLYKTENPCTSSNGPDGVPGTPDDVFCPDTDTVTEIHEFGAAGDSLDYTDWKVGFEYDLNESSMIYGHVATGSKTGGLQPIATNDPIEVAEPISLDNYKSEESTAYEIGSKNRFLDNSLQLNMALFYTVWDNMQLNSLTCVTPGCYPFSDPSYVAFYNAGKSTQYGVEGELVWLPVENGQLRGSLSLMHGEYGATDYAWGAPGFSGIVNLDGFEMANTPSYSGSVGYTHKFPVFDTQLITASIEMRFSDSYETTHEYFFDGHTQESYTMTNVNLAWDIGNFTVNAFVNNIEDELIITSVFPFGVQVGVPRTYGAAVSWHY